MAKGDLLVFLNKLDTELKRSSAEYRRFQANKRAHIFRFNAKDFATQIKIQCLAQKIPLSNADRKFINTEGYRLLAELKSKLISIRADRKKLSQGKTFVRMTFTSDIGVDSQYGDPDSVYGKIYDAYRPCLKKSFGLIQNYLRDQEFKTEAGRTKKKTLRTKSGKEREAAGRELNLGHIEGKSVIESFIRDAFDDVLSNAQVFTDSGDALSESDIRADMKTLGIDVSIIKDAKIDTYTVQLEADRKNKADGQELKRKKKSLQDQIARAIERLGGIEDLKGSTSIKENKIRATRSIALDAFKKLGMAGVTVVAGEELKQDLSKSSAKDKNVPGTVKARTRKPSMGRALPKRLKTRRVAAKKGIASDMLRMIAMINKQLPDVVRKNMNAPALQNRSGRFVDSVEVTEVVQTPKGFPSIGYKYAKNPYQVYEMGAGSAPWATPERDPRKLIDASIREIARKLAIGRFFTRRV